MVNAHALLTCWRWDATPKIVMIFGGLQLALMSFAFQAPNISKAIGCELMSVLSPCGPSVF
eukprot:scaffold58143_cov21-Tisochrysis_lutea.AAC.1